MEGSIAYVVESVCENYLFTFIIILCVYVVATYGYGPFRFWKKIGVRQVNVKYPFIGNALDSLRCHRHELSVKVYNDFSSEPYVGMYEIRNPALMIRDPDLIEKVLIKNFSSFINRGHEVDTNGKGMTNNLQDLRDDEWKTLRSKLMPTFTSGKLKGMHPQLIECTESLLTMLKQYDDGRPFDVKDVMSRLTMDIIASCAFGLNIDTINNPDSEFRKMGLAEAYRHDVTKKRSMIFRFFLPRILWIIADNLMGSSSAIDKFFTEVIDSTLDYRKRNNITRKDFLHLMNEIRVKEQEMIEKKELDGDDPHIFDHSTLVSNAIIFFLAGFETTSTTISYCLYELAMNQDVQEKVYQEVSSVLKKHNGEASYDAVADMHYLEQTISETLRLHPPAVSISRKVNKEYHVPDSDLVLTPGVNVVVPIYALHHDPQYFPEPEKFRPERFDDENASVRKGTYLPFGDGPRVCIGERFAKMVIKVVLASILSRFCIVPCDKTAPTMKYDRRSYILIPEGGIWLAKKSRTV